jgi:hypothetical protein
MLIGPDCNMPDNSNDWPLEVVVHSDSDFQEFARASGYDEDTINSLNFQSINVPSDGVIRLHVPMWRWEVDKEELGKHPVTFL